MCSIPKSYKATTAQSINPLVNHRLEVLRWVKQIHEINLNCIKAIETCVLNGQKQKAVLIKAKQIYLRKIASNLQDRITKIDSTIESSNEELKRKVLNDMEKSWNGINDLLLANDLEHITKIDMGDLQVIELENLLENFISENRAEIITELDRDVEKIKRLNDQGTFERRKYIKPRNL